jgi:hypothetical protein
MQGLPQFGFHGLHAALLKWECGSRVMTTATILRVIIAGAIFAWIVFKIYSSLKLAKNAADFEIYGLKLAKSVVSDVFPVWANLGPFQNGEESAFAFRAAYEAVKGLESAVQAEMGGVFEEHKAAFDLNAEGWEQIRFESADDIAPDDNVLRIAKGLFDIEKAKHG